MITVSGLAQRRQGAGELSEESLNMSSCNVVTLFQLCFQATCHDYSLGFGPTTTSECNGDYTLARDDFFSIPDCECVRRNEYNLTGANIEFNKISPLLHVGQVKCRGEQWSPAQEFVISRITSIVPRLLSGFLTGIAVSVSDAAFCARQETSCNKHCVFDGKRCTSYFRPARIEACTDSGKLLFTRRDCKQEVNNLVRRVKSKTGDQLPLKMAIFPDGCGVHIDEIPHIRIDDFREEWDPPDGWWKFFAANRPRGQKTISESLPPCMLTA